VIQWQVDVAIVRNNQIGNLRKIRPNRKLLSLSESTCTPAGAISVKKTAGYK